MAAKKSVSNKVVATEPAAKSIGGSPTATKSVTPTTGSGSKNRVLLLDVAPETKSTGGAPTIEKIATPATAGASKQQVSVLDVGSETKSLTKAVTALDTEPGTESATASATPQIGPVSTSKSLGANSFLPKAEKPAERTGPHSGIARLPTRQPELLDRSKSKRGLAAQGAVRKDIAHPTKNRVQLHGAIVEKDLGAIPYPKKPLIPDVPELKTLDDHDEGKSRNQEPPQFPTTPFGGPAFLRNGIWTRIPLPSNGIRAVDVGVNHWMVWITTTSGDVWGFDRRSAEWRKAPRPSGPKARRISVSFADLPWVVTEAGSTYRLENESWTELPHAAGGVDIAVGAEPLAMKVIPAIPQPDDPTPKPPPPYPFPGLGIPPHVDVSYPFSPAAPSLVESVYRVTPQGWIERLGRDGANGPFVWVTTQYRGSRTAVRRYDGAFPLWFVEDQNVKEGSSGPEFLLAGAPVPASDVGVGSFMAAILGPRPEATSVGLDSAVFAWLNSRRAWFPIDGIRGRNIDVAEDGTIWTVDSFGNLYVYGARQVGVWTSGAIPEGTNGPFPERIPCQPGIPTSLISSVLPNLESPQAVERAAYAERVFFNSRTAIVPLLVSWRQYTDDPVYAALIHAAMRWARNNGVRLILNLMPIFTSRVIYPKAFDATSPSDQTPEQLPFTSLTVAFIDFVKKVLAESDVEETVAYIAVGNEVDVFLLQSAGLQSMQLVERYKNYREFLVGVKAAIRDITPHIPIGVTTTLYSSLSTLPAFTQVVAGNRLLVEASDVAIVTYYPFGGSTHRVLEPSVVEQDWQQALEAFQGKPIVFQEIGYPSSPTLQSPGLPDGRSNQAKFLANALTLWSSVGVRVPALCWFNLFDSLFVESFEPALDSPWSLNTNYSTLKPCPGSANFTPVNFNPTFGPTLAGEGDLTLQQEAIDYIRSGEGREGALAFGTSGLYDTDGIAKDAAQVLANWLSTITP